MFGYRSAWLKLHSTMSTHCLPIASPELQCTKQELKLLLSGTNNSFSDPRPEAQSLLTCCGTNNRPSDLLTIEEAPPEEAEFQASDPDLEESLSDSDVHYASDGSGFFASDGEGPERKRLKRQYRQRRTDELQFMGKPVCARACARLLAIGQTTLQRMRRGENIQ